LTNLLKKSFRFVLTNEHQIAFERLNAILKNSPLLKAPDFDKSLKLAVGGWDNRAGAVLIQEDNNIVHQPF
jgi:hypothetical protein